MAVRKRLVTGAVPLFWRVSERFDGAPRATLPKVRADGVMTSLDAVPTPVSWMVSGRVVAEVTTETVPVRVPAATGLNETWIVQLALGTRVPPGEGQVPVGL